MQIQILLYFMIGLSSIAIASPSFRRSRQMNAESNLSSDRWAWGFVEPDDRPTRSTSRRPITSTTVSTTSSTESSTSSSTESSTSSSTDFSTVSTTDFSTSAATDFSISSESTSTLSSSSATPDISSPTTPVISSSSSASVVTPNPAVFVRCMLSCMRTAEYNPLCALLDNGTRKQYGNDGEMNCAAFCGENSRMLFRGSCTALI